MLGVSTLVDRFVDIDSNSAGSPDHHGFGRAKKTTQEGIFVIQQETSKTILIQKMQDPNSISITSIFFWGHRGHPFFCSPKKVISKVTELVNPPPRGFVNGGGRTFGLGSSTKLSGRWTAGGTTKIARNGDEGGEDVSPILRQGPNGSMGRTVYLHSGNLTWQWNIPMFNTSSQGPLSISMLVYQRVRIYEWWILFVRVNILLAYVDSMGWRIYSHDKSFWIIHKQILWGFKMLVLIRGCWWLRDCKQRHFWWRFDYGMIEN